MKVGCGKGHRLGFRRAGRLPSLRLSFARLDRVLPRLGHLACIALDAGSR